MGTKQLLIILSLLIACQVTNGQVWPRYYGLPNRTEFSHDVIESYDKGYIILGNYLSQNFVQKASWIIKTDVNGEILWEKVLSNIALNKSFGLDQTLNGGFIICGGIWRQGNNFSEPFVVKLNVCGEKEWCKVFAGSPNEMPWAIDIKETSTGDIIVLVNMYGQYPEETMHLYKLDAWGNVLWKYPYASGFVHPNGANPLGSKITLTSAGKYLVTGDVYWRHPWEPGSPNYYIRPLFVLIDSLGNEEWVLPFGLNDTIIGTAKTTYEPLNNGQFISTGSYWIGSNYIKPFFMKYDILGNEISFDIEEPTNFNPDFSEGAFTRIIQKDSSIYLQGLFELQPGNVYKVVNYEIDTGIFQNPLTINSSYFHENVLDPYTLIELSDNKLLSNAKDILTTPYDNIYLAKMNSNLELDTLNPVNYTYDSLCIPGPPQSGVISLDACDIVTHMDEIPTPEEYYAGLKTIPIKVFPNPVPKAFGNVVTFGFENTEYLPPAPPSVPPNGGKWPSLRIYNIYGEKVHEERIYRGQGESRLHVGSWPRGMYIAVVVNEGRIAGRAKFVVR